MTNTPWDQLNIKSASTDEQAEAGFLAIGRNMAAMYGEMIANGVPPKDAVELTKYFVHIIWVQQVQLGK